ncbi:unnamed protein product [Victoria cruziana]
MSPPLPKKLKTSSSEAEPSTRSSSPNTRESSEFDVFLSFRGEDTRKGFTGHLYEGLKLRGVSPFIDNENLQKGDEIERLLGYIEKSKVCIPIISKGYADSKWCLKELAQMLELKKKVIPVFFDVDLSDVKHRSGPFSKGFEQHEKLKAEEVGKWREAFAEVGNRKGYTLKEADGYEAKLVNIIVKRVLDEVTPGQLHVGQYVVGHEPHLEKLNRLMDVESNDVRMIGIHGIGGIGKTTLVKAIYNKLLSSFDACSFVSDVRSKDIETLQKQLLNDVFGRDKSHDIRDKSRGIALIKGKIGNKRVLIVLDDVDHRNQLRALVGSRDWFPGGSRIIITTRDIRPLNQHGVKDHEIYELTELDHDNSMKLFCHHAFGSEKASIRKEFADMCDEAVSSMKGLPLALEVLGSEFFGLETEKKRRKFLANLKANQNEEIFDKLKLSYDSLDDNEKHVFLDIACFFLGNKGYRWWVVDEVKQFWEACGFHPELAINVLKRKALIKIIQWKKMDDTLYYDLKDKVGRWRFEMHDQIRDMGRKIVKEERKSCSRFWKYDPKVKRALQGRGKRVRSVQGIMSYRTDQMEQLASPDLQQMNDLRMFHVEGGIFKGFPRFPKRLKWLGLPNCQHIPDDVPTDAASIPSNDLVVLDLCRNIDVAGLLLSISRTQIFSKLKVLDLSYTDITVTPDFSTIPYLVKLTLVQCRALVEVHESLGKLKDLTWLDLRRCQELTKLPDTICNLTSLEFLSLQGCERLVQLPEEFGNLTSLKHLDLRTQSLPAETVWISLPKSMRNLCVLENMFIGENIRGIISMSSDRCLVAASQLICSSGSVIEALPDACCKRKTDLQLIDNVVEDLTDEFVRWENIESLALNCRSLKSLPAWVCQLQKLKFLAVQSSKLTLVEHLTDESVRRWENMESLILNCRSLKSLPVWVRQLQKLKLLMVHSGKLTLVDDALPLESLEQLALECAVLKHDPSSINRKAENLETLILKCKTMETVPDWVGSSSNLETLSLYGGPLTVIPDFIGFPCLEELMITNCKELIEVHRSIGILNKLKILKITSCPMLERLPDSICELVSLEIFDLKGCKKLSSLPQGWEDRLCSLQELCLDETGIRSPPALNGKLRKLQSLSIKNCEFLKGRPPSLICYLESLQELYVADSHSEGMPANDYFMLDSSGTLRASTSWELMDVLPTSCCPSVTRLCFTDERIEKLTDSIGRFRNVKFMTLKCKMLKVLPNSLVLLEELEHLTLQCHTLALFDNMHFPGSIESRKVMKKLRRLELSVQKMTVTPDFSFAPCLEELILKYCEMLLQVHSSIGKLDELQSLKIIRCNALKGLPDTICCLTSLQKLKLAQEFDLSSSTEPSRDLEKLGLCEAGMRGILSSIGNLTDLKELQLHKSSPSCPGFKGIKWHHVYRDLFYNGFKVLEVSGCCLEITALSPHLLESVEILYIMDDQIEELPESIIRQMEGLQKLVLNCESLKVLPKCIRQLECLDGLEVDCDYNFIFFFEMWKRENVEQITTLRLGCKNITRLPDSVARLKNLERLDLSTTRILEFPPWFPCFTSLTDLTMKNIVTLEKDGFRLLSGLSKLPALTYLDVSENNFESLPSCISNFPTLKVLKVSRCKHLHSIPHISSPILETLDVSECEQLHSVQLSSSVLEAFVASDCKNLRVMPDLSNMKSLKCLYLGGCNSLDSIPGFQTIAETIRRLKLPGPSGGIESSNLGDYFKNNVFKTTLFRRLEHFGIGGNIYVRPLVGQQCLSFLFPDFRFNFHNKLLSLSLTLAGSSSPIKVQVIMEDDRVIFEDVLTEDDFVNSDVEGHSETFSFRRNKYGKDIFDHLEGGSYKILVWTHLSKLSKVKLKAMFVCVRFFGVQ